jgi:hypothetical protein
MRMPASDKIAMAMLGSLLLASVVGCGFSSGQGTSVAGSPEGGRQHEDFPVPPLPIDGYMIDFDQEQQLRRAQAVIITECMARFGFDYVAPEFDEARLRPGGGTNRLRRYGIADMRLARQNGYHLPPEQRAPDDSSNDPVMSKTERRVFLAEDDPWAEQDSPGRRVGGKKVPPGGCSGEARREIRVAKRRDLARTINAESFSRSLSHPEVRKVIDAWSACMKGKGYRYPSPLDMGDVVTSAEPTEDEISTALADIKCKKNVKLISVWHRVESAIQQRMISKKEEALVAQKEHLDRALKIAAETLTE